MCVTVRHSDRVVEPWDEATNTVTIPAHLDGEWATRAVRTVLSRLAVGQPPVGAVCWCGDRVHIPAPARIPDPRRPSEVMAHGA